MKEGKLTSYGQKDGLPGESVQALYLDPQGTLWIATRHGLSRLRDGRFTSYTASNGLHTSHIYGFVEDDAGKLWMSCAKGIFRVGKQQLEDFAFGRIRSIVSVAYGREHGLPSTMSAVATHPVGLKSHDGRVWMATRGGLVVVDPKALATNRVAPPVRIEEVSIDARAYAVDRLAEAPPGSGD